ncbi:MAG: hydantoinase/oxoprolinase family protein [Pseudomonadota bacterium]
MTASCAVLPEIKEYERTSTTVVNAYILGAMAGLSVAARRAPARDRDSRAAAGGRLAWRHDGRGRRQRAAGVSRSPRARPAGVSGAARLGQVIGDRNIVVFDMGGTTAKASIIDDGVPALTTEYEFREGMSSPSRFIKGGGYLLKVPSIDIAEVGSGGGSLAAVDPGGLLLVGPESAGADPGPACYGRGNDRPTVTDANLLLGFLNPGGLAGGARCRSTRRAARPRSGIMSPNRSGISAVDAAHGIREVATVTMARAIRAVTVERGRDPRDMTLMAFGGNGPVFAVELARQLGITRILVPPMSGVFCAGRHARLRRRAQLCPNPAREARRHRRRAGGRRDRGADRRRPRRARGRGLRSRRRRPQSCSPICATKANPPTCRCRCPSRASPRRRARRSIGRSRPSISACSATPTTTRSSW